MSTWATAFLSWWNFYPSLSTPKNQRWIPSTSPLQKTHGGFQQFRTDETHYLGGWAPSGCKWLGSPPFTSHVYRPFGRGINLLGDLLNMAINHLLTGVILQVGCPRNLGSMVRINGEFHLLLVGGWTTHLKNMLVKMAIFPRDRGESKEC